MPIVPFAMAAPPDGGSANPIVQLVPLLLIVAIFWLLIIRPQQKRQSEHKKMIAALAKGDRILTNGGLYGVVLNVNDKEGVLLVQLGEGVKVEMAQNAVAARVEGKKAAKAAKAGKKG